MDVELKIRCMQYSRSSFYSDSVICNWFVTDCTHGWADRIRHSEQTVASYCFSPVTTSSSATKWLRHGRASQLRFRRLAFCSADCMYFAHSFTGTHHSLCLLLSAYSSVPVKLYMVDVHLPFRNNNNNNNNSNNNNTIIIHSTWMIFIVYSYTLQSHMWEFTLGPLCKSRSAPGGHQFIGQAANLTFELTCRLL